MKDLLMLQTDKETKRLNTYGDILIGLSAVDKTELFYLFDDLQQAISNIDVAIMHCFSNNELLVELIPYINNISFRVASFIGRVMELEEELL